MNYDKSLLKSLKHPFPGVENIQNNYSETCQDMYVLTMLNGKRDGYFLEIGAQDPIKISNTYLLESQFNWKGISIDLDPNVAPKHKEHRKNIFISGNALEIDYAKILVEHNFPHQIDYLQVDIDPCIQSLNCLKVLPLEEFRFSVITFETDEYRGGEGPRVRAEERQILKSYGYELMAGHICNHGPHDFYEDWWVDPAVISAELIDKFQRSLDTYMRGAEYLGILEA